MLRRLRLEILLILSVVLLIGQLAWPSVARWWTRPTPGAIGVDRLGTSIDGIADDFLAYLPSDYCRGANPLIVYLHGSGERGNDPAVLRDCGPFEALQNGVRIPAIVVGPQCRPYSTWSSDSIMRFAELVAPKYAVDRKRIYLVGHSMGGHGTWRTAAAYPDAFAAIVPISGGGDPDMAKSLTELPVWAFHGEKDTAVSVTACEAIIEAIEAAGGHPKLTIIPGAGHGICDDVCQRADLWEWLLNQRTSDDRPVRP